MSHISKITDQSNLRIANSFVLSRLITTGNCAETWEARDIKQGCRVLLKFLPVKLYSNSRYWSRMQQVFARTQELHHPGIHTFYHLGQTPQPLFFIVSRYLEGKTLEELFKRSFSNGKHPSLNVMLHILWQVASILDASHAKQIGHFSLKPGNIFICEDGIRITDFLIPAEIRSSMQSQMMLFDFSKNDFFYLSPEQLNGQSPTKRSDVFSLASLAYRVLVGSQPDYTTWNELLSPNASSPLFMKTIHPELDSHNCKNLNAILSRGLSLSPEIRHTSCREFVGQLLQCLDKKNNLYNNFELYTQCFSSDEFEMEDHQESSPSAETPEIVINTNRKQIGSSHVYQTKKSLNMGTLLTILIHIVLSLAICSVAYVKRDLLLGYLSGDAPKQQQTVQQPVAPVVVIREVQKPRQVTPPIRSPNTDFNEVVNQELQEFRQISPLMELDDDTQEDVDEYPEGEIENFVEPILRENTEIQELPSIVASQIKSDANSVYESGFIASTWEIEASKIRELADTRIEAWQQGAQHGLPEACYLMAWCHGEGFGKIKKNNKTAFELLLSAAEGGYPPAQYDVGVYCYARGFGTRKNRGKADDWIRRAINNDEKRALYYQAEMFLKKDQMEEGKEVLQRLSKMKFLPAQKRLEEITAKKPK